MLIGYFPEYKGFCGTIEYDICNGYHGKIATDKFLATYEAFNVGKLHEEFKTSIDELIDMVNSIGGIR